MMFVIRQEGSIGDGLAKFFVFFIIFFFFVFCCSTAVVDEERKKIFGSLLEMSNKTRHRRWNIILFYDYTNFVIITQLHTESSLSISVYGK